MRIPGLATWGFSKPPISAPVEWGDDLANGLTVCWHFSEAGGATIRDLVAGRYTASLVSGFSYAPALTGIGLSCNPSGTTGISWSGPSLGLTFSIEIRVRATSLPALNTTGNLGAHSGSGDFSGLWIRNSGGTTKFAYYDVSQGGYFSGNTVLSANTWYHLVVSVNNGTLQYYLNGEPDGSSAGFVLGSRSFNFFGNDIGGDIFTGLVDYYRIWLNRALTAVEARSLYLEPFSLFNVPAKTRFILATSATYNQTVTPYGVFAAGATPFSGGKILGTPNFDPIFTKTPDVSFNVGTGMNQLITAAANDYTGAGANNSLVFTADGTNGSYIQRLRFKAAGTNAASVARIFLNNGSANTTATNNVFYGEVSLPDTTATATATSAEIDYLMNFALPAGFRIYVGLGTAVAGGWIVMPVAGRY